VKAGRREGAAEGESRNISGKEAAKGFGVAVGFPSAQP